jgi:hypothetical protein
LNSQSGSFGGGSDNFSERQTRDAGGLCATGVFNSTWLELRAQPATVIAPNRSKSVNRRGTSATPAEVTSPAFRMAVLNNGKRVKLAASLWQRLSVARISRDELRFGPPAKRRDLELKN